MLLFKSISAAAKAPYSALTNVSALPITMVSFSSGFKDLINSVISDKDWAESDSLPVTSDERSLVVLEYFFIFPNISCILLTDEDLAKLWFCKILSWVENVTYYILKLHFLKDSGSCKKSRFLQLPLNLNFIKYWRIY